MTKNKFAGLAEAKLKSLDGEEAKGNSEPVKETEKKAVRAAKKPTSKLAHKKTTKQVSKKAIIPDSLVGVTIKIPESKRIWWNVQAKMQRTTVTDAIVEALDKRFGEPKF